MSSSVDITVTIGADSSVATIRKSNCSTPIVADLLAVELDNSGRAQRLYLRSKIHTKNVNYEGWEPSGAISTILMRIEKGRV